MDPLTSHCGTFMDPDIYVRLASGGDDIPTDEKCGRHFRLKQVRDYVPAFEEP